MRLRTTCHPTEDAVKVEGALRFVAGVPEDEFREHLAIQPVESHHGGTVQLMDVVLDRSRAVRDVLGRILDLPGVRENLTASADARTDDDGVFYLRVDKQEAFQGRLVMTQGEDAVQLRLKLEVYPADREASLAAIRRLLASAKP